MNDSSFADTRRQCIFNTSNKNFDKLKNHLLGKIETFMTTKYRY